MASIVSNQQIMQAEPQAVSFSAYVNSKQGQKLIANAIPNQAKREAFATAIISAVSNNPALQECTKPSILAAALQGVALGLAPSPQLGQFYMVPFKNNKAGTSEAVFVPGYKGYIQLALRTGQYLDLDARPVVDGEYRGLDRLTGRPVFQWVEDDTIRDQLAVIGYMAYFELINGARKVLYWSKEKMISHADRYSPAFSREATTGKYPKVSFEDYQAGSYPKKDEWLYSSFWYKDFDTMACKTMLRQLITRWGPVSIEMEKAITQDTQSEISGADYGVDLAEAAIPPAASGMADADAEEISQVESEEPQMEQEPAPEEVSLDDI